jgi:hypothetical protein
MYFKIIKLKYNSAGYKYNVQLWRNSYYTGNGRFIKDKVELKRYIKANNHIEIRFGKSYLR